MRLPTRNLFFLLLIAFASCEQTNTSPEIMVKSTAYYLSSSGDNKNKGTQESPWKTINHINSIHLIPGDTVYFKGDETFNGSILIDSNESGTKEHPVVFSSYGSGSAVIDGGNATALRVNKASYIHIEHLDFMGAGRKEGNTRDGIAIIGSHHIMVDSLEIKGFQKAGLLVYSSSDVDLNHVYAHDNGFAGISVSGEHSKTDCNHIYIGYCKAENNPGDPTNLENHSGNGIIAGFCKNVIIEYSTATNNGWDMPRKGNGPVGIWCYEADSVIIQHCISYRNKTSPGASDGGGFDLDGGVINSVIQYCLSYENEGSGFGLFQYAGAGNWYNNTIRFNISENDGNISAAHAGIFIWNSSRDATQLKTCFIYNNTIYNEKGAAISYEKESENSGFYFYNNIFVAKDELITGHESTGVFLGNDWWSIDNGFNIGGIRVLPAWAKQQGKEQWNNMITGLNINPQFINPGKASITDPLLLKSFANYRLPPGSPLREKGLDLQALFGMNTGEKDFNQKVMATSGRGACF